MKILVESILINPNDTIDYLFVGYIGEYTTVDNNELEVEKKKAKSFNSVKEADRFLFMYSVDGKIASIVN